jgi:hypothetical protein
MLQSDYPWRGVLEFPFPVAWGREECTDRERNKTDRREDPERDDKTQRNMEIEIRNMEKMRERHE